MKETACLGGSLIMTIHGEHGSMSVDMCRILPGSPYCACEPQPDAEGEA